MAPALGPVVGEDHQSDPGGLSSTRQVPQGLQHPHSSRLAYLGSLGSVEGEGLEEITLGWRLLHIMLSSDCPSLRV